ncbi:helix-turn-helix domain-containing protein [Paenibacillus popilliae]|uniref:Predicted transcriptional regulator n=1 Tax=Paenibacillus popilliae ATCC 14706 TaxID=1212764 RepID=M9LAQ6_PAEPP|nr:helix-turn-helix transcriptional regulator [Paenibacillus popilliae]GAC42772.1 predicted transcriptional regulator [Paenibacillus popilliae ATCC 14706]
MVNKLKQIRETKGMTQQEAANALGVTVRMYQHIEKGTRRPSYEVLCKLENLFGMTHRELLAKTDEA